MYFSIPKEVDKHKYTEANNESYFGLDNNVKFCQRCVISNQRPSSSVEFKNNKSVKKSTIKIAEDNICDACKVREIKQKINFSERESELRELCDKYRKNDGNYDCLIPGSGGKDSFMQAHLLKYKYGMNPLTVTWAPNIYTDWGWKNHQAWVNAGFDNILFTPNGIVHRLLTRISMENIFHPFQAFIIGQKNIGPKLAAKYDISLVFYGENESEYGQPKEDFANAKMSWQYFMNKNQDEIFLGGSSLKDLKEMGLSSNNLNLYMPIDPQIIEDKKIAVHYLGYYERWHPQSAYYYAIENGGFKAAPERNCGTYQTYQSIDDKLDDFHYHTTYIKFGIGRATYDAAQEIRNGDITREEGVALVKRYDGEFPKRWSQEVFDYLSITGKGMDRFSKYFEQPIFDSNYYDLLCDKNRSPHLWKYSDADGWQLKHKVKDLSNDISQEISASSWSGNK